MSRGRFRREKKLVALSFDESTGLDGFECIMRSVPLDKMLVLARLTSALEQSAGRTTENIEALFTTVGGLLEEWNLDDEDGNPVPCNYQGLASEDLSFAQAILAGYMQALSSVPKASNSNSAAGEPLEELSIPMEPSLPSPLS